MFLIHTENRRYEDIESVTRRRRWATRTFLPAVSLALMVCLLMITSTTFTAVSGVVASAAGDYNADETPDDALSDSSTTGQRTRALDWEALASEDGVVDVIVVLPESESAESVMIRSAASQADPGCLELRDIQPASTFSASINGFTASLSPQAINSLASLVPGAIIYPDLPVKATLSKSVNKVGADQVWSRYDTLGNPVTGEGIVVAVIDTGIDYTHPDLGGGFGPAYKVIGGYDFINKDSDPMDDNGHGTHVAGIISADGATPGVAPSTKLLAYKVLGSDGAGPMSLVVSAIDAALDPNGDGVYDDRADVISMSLGGSGDPDDPVCMAVEEVISMGVVVVIAAGNDGPSLGTVASPGLAACAITVGAVDDDGAVAAFSSRGPAANLMMKPEITAPGVQIVSTVPYSGVRYSSPTGYMAMSGTSMATPHVSGAAALMLQMHPDWTPDMIKSALVSNSNDMGDSYWVGGAGEIWIPGSMDSTIFSSIPFVSYGMAGDPSVTFQVFNAGASIGLSSASSDWLSMTADGDQIDPVMSSLSSVSPSYRMISSGGQGDFTIEVSGAISSNPEGYYDGELLLTSGQTVHRIVFGFVVLSKINVHVYNEGGYEVFDPYGGVFAYSLPDADIAVAKRGNIHPSPPASFLLPSGDYAIHAIGHQLVYVYSNPYLLSTTVSLAPMQTLEVNLYMSAARAITIDLQTEGGQPIFVKDFRMYIRYEGTRNVSFDLTGSDYSIVGPELFSIPDSLTVFLSDTDAEIGIAVSGFSYTQDMWDFMELNWDHWFEYITGTSTSFMFEASADLQYLLAWEFDGVDAGVPSSLTWSDGTTRSYVTKYDIPGPISSPWCNWGDHRSAGGDATFFVRRDTDTSLNLFFSGMTRTTIVRGTFTELYYPMGLFEGFFERQYYTPDYDHLLRAGTASEILLPDRNFLEPLEQGTVIETLGVGPFYPSVRTENTDDTLALFHPLLREQSGARVGGKTGPSLTLYRNGGLVGLYQLSEYLARPDAVRHIDLFGDGSYSAKIHYHPSSHVYDDVTIELGFAIPSTDRDPPVIAGMELPQRFAPGEDLLMAFEAYDSQSSVMASASYRPSGTSTWNSLTLQQSSGSFTSAIPTRVDDAGIDIMIEAVDTFGNSLRYTAEHASLAEVPVVFELSPVDATVRYGTSPEQVVLQGQLTDMLGNPLNAIAGVPLELDVGDVKVGMILDEYMTATSHTHNGQIRFDWELYPTSIFSGPNETVTVTVAFDMGVYSPIEVAFQLRSVDGEPRAPLLTLVSPENGALIASGDPIILSVDDDGQVTMTYSLDGGSDQPLEPPYEISTDSWADGIHDLSVTVTDDDSNVVSDSYSFDVDALSPAVSIITPADGSVVPKGYYLEAQVSDSHLATVTMSVDGGSPEPFLTPYIADMTGWSIGNHTVTVRAIDAVGHVSSSSTIFEIANSTIVLSLASPADGAFIRSGTPIEMYLLSSGTVSCQWASGGGWSELTSPYAIATDGWEEGSHEVTVSATDDLGSSAEIEFAIVIDDTYPVISLVSPRAGAFVTSDDSITIRVDDANFFKVVWSLSGFVGESSQPDVSISLAYFMIEGYFTLEIIAMDLAGNVAEESLVFSMDSAAPVIEVTGVVHGSAIAPQDSISVSVVDPFLESVGYSIDDQMAGSGSSAFSIGLDSLALGWHNLEITASDRNGLASSLSLDFYLDGMAPVIDLISDSSFEADEDYEISVAVSDDFQVSSVKCRYETDAGSFSERTLTHQSNGLYTASLEAALLRDGMTLYVIAEDTAGNHAETDAFILSAGSGDETDDRAKAPFGSTALSASIGIAAGIALVALGLFSRRRRNNDPKGDTALESVDAHEPRAGGLNPPAESAQDDAASGRNWANAQSIGGSAEGDADRDHASMVRTTAVEPMIPTSESTEADDEVIECFEDLERELNLALINRSSIFRERNDGPPPIDVVSEDSRTPDSVPITITGLKLKRLMDKDR
ncbi:MAG: S8 family serine peptidase [Methanobacteriota archaeon]|nr:MAG: S8 family serine peptidase [Euryarchaeota archaeon]